MGGGYLRVMYPEPEVCLNLPAWQEFCGFDRTGQNAWFDIGLDPETLALRFSASAEAPFGLPRQLERLALLCDPAQVAPVAAGPRTPADLRGVDRGDNALPGPLAAWE